MFIMSIFLSLTVTYSLRLSLFIVDERDKIYIRWYILKERKLINF